MKNKKVYIILFTLFVEMCSTDSLAQIIGEYSIIQPAGLLNLKADNPSSVEQVRWEVTSYYKNENNLEMDVSRDTLESFGDSIKVLLIKNVGEYTFYKVKAENDAFSDSITFQVLNKGIPEKYLFENTVFPSKPIVVYLILPNDISTAKFVMVMHGVNRNSAEYANAWKSFAVNNNYVIAAPTFTDEDWPSSRSYNLGNMFPSSSSTAFINPVEEWTFTIVAKIHDELVGKLNLNDDKYTIWGHSAGAQFVHRLMIFKPDYKLTYALAANAGWYTMPDFEINYPYGLGDLSLEFEETFLEDLAIKNIVVMRGTDDTIRDSFLNTSSEADEQGLNRYQRAYSFYSYAQEIDQNHNWKLIEVENVGHEYKGMAEAAQSFLLNPTSVDTDQNITPVSFQLFQNYPNPFNNSTNISFYVPHEINMNDNFISLMVYNSLGEVVAKLKDQENRAGTTNIAFNAIDDRGIPLTSGVYFYRLSVGDFSISKKMILLK